MSEPINMLDDEYMTPKQRAELRKMSELPLWQDSANVAIDPHAIDCFSTEPPQVVCADVNTTDDAFSAWLADVELHRLINGTVGKESEE